jgi:PST family polysaccharide transporter
MREQDPPAPFRWALLGSLAPKAITPITTLVLPIFLEPRAFGLVAASALVVTAAQIIGGMGLGAAVVQRRADVKETASFSFWVGLSAAACLYLIAWVASPIVERTFGFRGLAAVIRVSALSLPLQALAAVPLGLLQRRMAFRHLFWIGVIAQVTGSAVALGLALTGGGVWPLVYGPLVAVLLQAVLALATAGWRPSFPWQVSTPPGLVSFSLWVSASNVVAWSFLQADNALVGYFLGAEALGIYALGFNLATVVPGLLSAPVSSVAYPQFSKPQLEGPSVVGAHLLALHRTVAAWLLPACIGVALLAPIVIPVVYGTRWPGLAAVIVVLSLTLGPSNLWSAINAQAFRGMGVPQAWLRAAVPALGLMVLALCLAAGKGLQGMVVARAGAEIMYPVMCVVVTASLLKLSIREQVGALRAPLVPAAGMAIVALTVALAGRATGALSGLPLAATMAAVGAAVYAVLLGWRSPDVLREALGT